MKYNVSELAAHFGLSYTGDGKALITHVCGLDGREPHGISYVESKRFIKKAMVSSVDVFVCPEGTELPGKVCLFAPYPDMMIVEITNFLHPQTTPSPGIHPSFIHGSDCLLEDGLSIGVHVVLGNRVKVGQGCILMTGTVIGDDCQIGKGCVLHPNVTIRDDSIIGDRVVINSGTVIGSEGYGFVTHKGKHYKIPQVGYVQIADDVEIGACNTIDRGRFGVTYIGKGTKTDNLVHVGHNVEIGEHSLIVAMAGLAGSTKTGHHLTMAGQSMLAGHLTIGSNITVSAKSLLSKNTEVEGQYSGVPARPHREWLKAHSYLYRLQKIVDFIKNFK